MPKVNSKPKGQKNVQVEKVYPEYYLEQYTKDSDAGPLTADKMKEILGWTEDKEEAEKAGVFHSTLTDMNGKKIYLTKNKGNRDFEKADALKYSQDMLTRNWKKNGEGLSVGDYGNVMSGQHRGIGLILGEQRRTSDKEKAHWKKVWGDEPLYIETHVVFGVPEDNETKRTVDNVRPRTLADVLSTNGVFDKVKSIKQKSGVVLPDEKKTICRVAEFAVKTLWERTGAKANPYSPYRTHAESMEFIDSHPYLLNCVTHVWQEYSRDWQVNNQRIPAGTAAGLMYLMAFSDSEIEKYEKRRSEKVLNGDQKSEAERFWVVFCDKANPLLKVLKEEIGKLSDEDADNSNISAEKIGMMCKAWDLFKDGSQVKADKIKVKREENAHGHMVIVDDMIDVAGIDVGPSSYRRSQENKPDEEVEEAIAKAKQEKEEKITGKKPAKKDKATPKTAEKSKGGKKEKTPVTVPDDDDDDGLNDEETFDLND